MRHLFSSPLGSCAPPCAPSFKCDGLPLSGGAGALLSLTGMGGFLGYQATSDAAEYNRITQQKTNEANKEMVEATNKTNREIADEANRYNKLLQDEQNAWNLQQWNRQNEYNDPSNQVARLKAAGINPYALYGSAGGSIPASQLTSAPAHPAAVAQMQAPRFEAYHEDISAKANAINGMLGELSNARLVNAQVDKLGNDVSIANAQNAREEGLQPWRLRYTENLAKQQGVLGDIAKQQLAYDQASAKYRLGLLMGDMRLQSENFRTMQVQRTNIELQNKLAEFQVAYAPKLNEAQLRQYYATVAQIKANIGLINANTLLTNEQKLTEIQKRIGTILNNNSIDLDNQLKAKMQSVVIDQAKADLYKTTAEGSALDKKNRGFYVSMPFGEFGFSMPQTSAHGTQYNWR